MSRKNKFVTAASTFSVALGIGFVMQYGDAVASRFQPAVPPMAPVALTPEVVMPRDVVVSSSLAIPRFDLQIAEDEGVQLAALNTDLVDVDAPTMDVPPVAVEPVCDIAMSADTLPLAMVALSINAPCNKSAAVTIHHQGLMYSYLTDEEGRVDIVVPAMAEEAFFISAFANGEGAVASTMVLDLAQVERAALQWQGISAVQLHAREFGAAYGSDGDVWKASAREINFAEPANKGFLVSLGDPRVENPMQAEVYTYPSGISERDGDVILTVEAEVTAENCGRDIAAQSIQLNSGVEPSAIDLTMTMPDCDAIGEFLVLKNMFKDMTLASK